MNHHDNKSRKQSDRERILNLWKHKTSEGDHNFTGKISGILLKSNSRVATISPMIVEELKSLAMSYAKGDTVFRVKFWIPKEIEKMEVKDFTHVDSNSQILEVNLKNSPSIKIQISKNAFMLLNEHASDWKEEIRFSFTLVQKDLGFGDEESSYLNQGIIDGENI